MSLTAEHQRLLIEIARDEILYRVLPEGKHILMKRVIPEVLREKCGAFVSIYVGKKLRGCIGTFSEDETLYENIKRMAYAAATLDSRFTPLKANEILKMRIEISVLTPRISITGPDDIEIGRHGIYMEHGTKRGTLLPQVAVSQRWTVEQFLENCAMHKAGLARDGWKYARLFTYEATVFDSDF
jgi:AmmeMemoRadiSam system protein A